MNCTEAERRIYLYEELTAREREETDQHLRGCSDCQGAMEAMSVLRSAVHSKRDEVPALPDEAALTSRIVNAVFSEAQRRKSVYSQPFRWSFASPFRYSMAIVSFVLAVTFVKESFVETQLSKPIATPRKAMELNTASFHEAFFKAREQKSLSSPPLYNRIVSCLYERRQGCIESINSDH